MLHSGLMLGVLDPDINAGITAIMYGFTFYSSFKVRMSDNIENCILEVPTFMC